MEGLLSSFFFTLLAGIVWGTRTEKAIDTIIDLNYPKDHGTACCEFEGEAIPRIPQRDSNSLSKKSKIKIGGILPPFHPFNLPGELLGQGTNHNWMLKQFAGRV